MCDSNDIHQPGIVIPTGAASFAAQWRDQREAMRPFREPLGVDPSSARLTGCASPGMTNGIASKILHRIYEESTKPWSAFYEWQSLDKIS